MSYAGLLQVAAQFAEVALHGGEDLFAGHAERLLAAIGATQGIFEVKLKGPGVCAMPVRTKLFAVAPLEG